MPPLVSEPLAEEPLSDLALAYDEGISCSRQIAAAELPLDADLTRRALEAASHIAVANRRILDDTFQPLQTLQRVQTPRTAIRALRVPAKIKRRKGPFGTMGATGQLAHSLLAATADDPQVGAVLSERELELLPYLHRVRTFQRAIGIRPKPEPVSLVFDARRHMRDARRPQPGQPPLSELVAAIERSVKKQVELYAPHLARYRAEGITAELTAACLDAAREAGAPAQALYRRPDLYWAQRSDRHPKAPLLPVLDQFTFASLCLTDEISETERETALLTEERLEFWMEVPQMVKVMQSS